MVKIMISMTPGCINNAFEGFISQGSQDDYGTGATAAVTCTPQERQGRRQSPTRGKHQGLLLRASGVQESLSVQLLLCSVVGCIMVMQMGGS